MRNKVLGVLENIKLYTLGHLSPVMCSKYLYKKKYGTKLNLENPQKFNEKLMYLKLYNYIKNPVVWKCVDKYLVREYANNKGINNKNLPVLLSEYKNASEIDFDKLPNKFVLKCTHGYHFNIICENKNEFDIKKARKTLNKWLKTKFGYSTA